MTAGVGCNKFTVKVFRISPHLIACIHYVLANACFLSCLLQLLRASDLDSLNTNLSNTPGPTPFGVGPDSYSESLAPARASLARTIMPIAMFLHLSVLCHSEERADNAQLFNVVKQTTLLPSPE